jgi:septal ring factor EnvC (AmiA/AmiB activator)
MIARIGRRIASIGGRASAGRFSHKPRHPESNPERQQRELERLREEVKERDERIAELQKQIGEKEKQIADLERQLALRKQNSTKSSKPPSSDGLAGEPPAGPRQEEPT